MEVEVTDPSKARAALGYLGGVFFADAALLLISVLVSQLLIRLGFEALEKWFTVQQVLSFATTCASAFALWSLTRAVKQSELLMVMLGCAGLLVVVDAIWLWQQLAPHEPGAGLSKPLTLVTVLVNLVVLFGSCVLLGKLGKATGFAAAIGAFVALKGLIALAIIMRAGPEHLPTWVYYVRSAVSLGCLAALGALAFNARGAVMAAAGGPQPGGLLQQPVVVEASGTRLILTGVVLLVLGIGVTVASYDAASGGGRYVIATGAIASGLVSLVRGLARAGR